MLAFLPFLQLFCALCIGHAVADYPLQGDFLSKGKNRYKPLSGVPWYWCLAAHAAIQAGFVWVITGSGLLGLAEFIVHYVTDDLKCYGVIDFDTDQLLHLLFKLLWATCVVVFLQHHV